MCRFRRRRKGLWKGYSELDNRRVLRRRRHPTHNAQGRRRRLTSIPSVVQTGGAGEALSVSRGGWGGAVRGDLPDSGGGYFADDLQKFCTLANVSMPEVQAVSVDGISTSAKDGAEGEVMLDVEVVAGVCPKARAL